MPHYTITLTGRACLALMVGCALAGWMICRVG